MSNLDKLKEQILKERKMKPLSKEETVNIVATATAEATQMTINTVVKLHDALGELVDKVQQLANQKIIVNPPDVKVESKEVKLEIPDTVKVSNLQDLKLPEPKVEVTTEKYEIVNENIDIEPLTKAIKDQKVPTGEGTEASKKADPTRYSIVRLSNGRQFIEPQVGGGVAGSSGEKVFPLVDITYDGSGNPTSIVKQADGVRVTQNIAYDNDNNPIRFTTKYDNI